MASNNALDIKNAGLVTYDATAGTFAGSTVTQYAVTVGGASNTVGSVGPGNAGQVLQSGGAASNPAYSTATYPATAGTSGKVLVSDGTNIVSSTPTFPNASATIRKIIVSDGTNWVASTETWATPSTSGNILTSDGTNWVSSAPASSAIPYTDQGSSTTIASNHGYFVTGNFTMTLPSSPSQGDICIVFADTTSVVTVTGNTGQVIRLGSSVTAAAGSIASTARGDCVRLVYRTSGTAWIAESAIGNWTI